MSIQQKTRWEQLAQMSWDELRTRAGQEMAKAWDAARYSLPRPWNHRPPQLRPAAAPAFFFAPDDLPRLIRLLKDRLPEQIEHTIQEAERICRHEFDLLGYRGLQYGAEIDWHADVVHGKRAPRRLWFRINCLDFEEVGDLKVAWELNRHQHLLTLAKAYRLTHEKHFVDELLRQWTHWRRENPYPVGVNWASSLEVAIRSMAWLWVWHLLVLDGSPVVPEGFRSALLEALEVSGRHIERYLSTYSSPNTHYLGEGVGLFFIGTLCPRLRKAGRWRRRGWSIVLREAGRQVQPDGMHFEQSVYYHVYALDFLLHARILAERNSIPVPAALDHTLARMLDVLRVLSQAAAPPRLGDDDGGRVFNARRNRAEHTLDPLATGAALFGRSDFKAAAAGLPEETLWLLGEKGVAAFDGLPSTLPPYGTVRLESCGLHVMSSAEPVRQQLVIDAGPQGTGNSGHGHADALSVVLSVDGREWLSDPGTFCYLCPSERDQFRGTDAHNTLSVDGLSQAEPAGPFAWLRPPVVRSECWITGKTFDLFAGSHTGYERLEPPVVHCRRVFHLRSQFWLVCDSALGQGTHRLEVSWHLGEGLVPARDDAPACFRLPEKNQALLILAEEAHGWSPRVGQGCISPAYGIKEPAWIVCFSKQTQLPASIAFVLAAVEGQAADFGKLTSLHSETSNESSGVRAYCYQLADISHFMFFAESGQPWKADRWASDAQFAYCRMAGNEPSHWILCHGSYVELDGKRVLGLEGAADWFESMG